MAKQFEVSKDFEKAMDYYEKSETHKKEVPRMLMHNGEFELLEQYVARQNDKELYKWWARFLESEQRIEEAMEFYKKGDDQASIVIISIF
jgi:intraflagellar transport protein 140